VTGLTLLSVLNSHSWPVGAMYKKISRTAILLATLDLASVSLPSWRRYAPLCAHNATAEVPNYFVFIGAYGPLGHGSVIPMVEFYTNYILQVLEKVQVEDIKSLQVKKSAAEAFTRHADEYLKRTAWSG
jgi:hypothetical protein